LAQSFDGAGFLDVEGVVVEEKFFEFGQYFLACAISAATSRWSAFSTVAH